MVLVLELSAEPKLWPRGLLELEPSSEPELVAGVLRPLRALKVLRGEVEAGVLLFLGLWRSSPGSKEPFW